jgi:O-antigen ligase
MLLGKWREWRHPVEFALLLALAFFLPLREAPKNLFWLAYLVAWVVARARSRDWGARLDGWDAMVACLVASGYLAALFGGIHRGDGNEFLAVNDIWRYGLLFVCMRRGNYDDAQKLLLLGMLVVSCVIAEFEAIWNWKVIARRSALELFSVGHVNHSAIYMAICLGIAAGLAAGAWSQLTTAWRILLGIAILALVSGLFLGGSRAAGAVAMMLVLAAAFVAARVARAGRLVWMAALLVILVGALLGGTSAFKRQIEWGAKNYTLAQRDLIWNRGLAGWRIHPVFGLGLENYGAFPESQLKAWVAEQGKPYVASEYAGAPHAHSLYLNTLVERGLVGLAALMVLLAAWGVLLARGWREARGGGSTLVYWMASASGWFVTVVIGFANTTLHHEHAMLALLTLALTALPARVKADG